MRVQATTNTCVLLVCIVWKVDCLSSAWKLAVLSPWEELYVILMNRGMGHISSLPAVMQLFRDAEHSQVLLWIHAASLLLSKAEC